MEVTLSCQRSGDCMEKIRVWSPASGICCFLAVQVHRVSKEIAALCTSQSAGVTRANQRAKKTLEVASVRAKEKEKRMRTKYRSSVRRI